ncbi:hypothetical protein F4818DRAFT_436878 [Hypoxylon cercidicola]|nr:hypothetical protein F4818DRAFT_436878 [Hypoxylon cercidicola]
MSSTTSSEHSKSPSLGGYARRLSIKPKSDITININNHYRSKVYTTGSEVSGYVAINPHNDVRFDALQIVLLGTSKTRVDAVSIPQATAHTFLKLVMPIPESSYPVPRIFEAGMTYTVPFTFIIPSTLTLNACSHRIANDSIREHHIRLPPTVGSWEKDDLAPDMSRVQYTIKARAYRDEDAGVSTKVMEAGREIRVLPAVPEDPPLNIAKHDDLYTMSKTKALRKTIISPKSGKVTITAQQPGAAMMSPDGQTVTSTTVPLDLEFEPASADAQLPKVTGITSKITAVTFFSAAGVNHYPNLENGRRSFGSEGCGSYSATTSASTGPVGPLQWDRHLTAQARRDSGYASEGRSSSSDSDASTARTPAKRKEQPSSSSSSSSPSPPVYTARLHVPVYVPAHKKTFVPTFHSCIASRVYVLWLTVSLASGGGGGTAHVALGVPLQIGVGSTSTATSGDDRIAELPPTFEEAEEAQADEYWRPRVLGVPAVEFDRGGVPGGALPGYADLAFRRRTVVAAH